MHVMGTNGSTMIALWNMDFRGATLQDTKLQWKPKLIKESP